MSDWTSPLVEIERSVQQRAKNEALDMNSTGAAVILRQMISEAIIQWTNEFNAGRRPFDIADSTTVAERAFRNIAGYGPLEPLLADDDVWEIAVNGPASIFVKRHSGMNGFHDEVFHDDKHVVRTLTKILDDAGSAHRKFDPAEGLQDAQLSNGSRLHIIHGDVARDGHTMFNIRKFTGVAVRSLDELTEREMLDTSAAKFLRACVQGRLSIVFAGAPGSGKTTLLTCCAAELDPTLRVVIAEEVFEIDLPLQNVAQLQTRPARTDRPEVDLRRLVGGFLRMAPDVAIVGEVRDKEALPLLLTLSSGVTGYTTIHAGNARQALTRLRFISQLADTSSELPLSALNSLVSEAVDVVVHCERRGPRTVVTEIIVVEDLQGSPDSSTFTTSTIFERDAVTGDLVWTGNVPARAARSLTEAGFSFDNVGQTQ